MANAPVLGGSPVAFTDANGAQHEIPLSRLVFDSNGIDAGNWPPYTSYKSIVDPWLASLVAQGLLWPGQAPTGKPALTIIARESGAAGDAISITFANPNAATGTVDVTVTAQQNWRYLTSSSIESVLGTGPGSGSQPGLVVLVTPAPAAGVMPAAATLTPAGTPPRFAVPKQGGGTAFTLAPLYNDASQAADAALLSVKITPDAGNAWFSLSASWSKAVSGAKLTDLTGTANPLAYLVSFKAPVGGLVGPPDAATLTLQGGTDSPATAASAIAVQG